MNGGKIPSSASLTSVVGFSIEKGFDRVHCWLLNDCRGVSLCLIHSKTLLEVIRTWLGIIYLTFKCYKLLIKKDDRFQSCSQKAEHNMLCS